MKEKEKREEKVREGKEKKRELYIKRCINTISSKAYSSWKNNNVQDHLKDCAKKKYETSSKRKSVKYWRIEQIMFSHFLVENKKTRGTVITHFDIEHLVKLHFVIKVILFTSYHIFLLPIFSLLFAHRFLWLPRSLTESPLLSLTNSPMSFLKFQRSRHPLEFYRSFISSFRTYLVILFIFFENI